MIELKPTVDITLERIKAIKGMYPKERSDDCLTWATSCKKKYMPAMTKEIPVPNKEYMRRGRRPTLSTKKDDIIPEKEKTNQIANHNFL